LSFDYKAYQSLWEISIAFGLTGTSWPTWRPVHRIRSADVIHREGRLWDGRRWI